MMTRLKAERICPKIVCLNEETLKLHLLSKRRARSEKLLSNGKLKCMLNSDGEEENLEEEGETHAERHARILSLATSQKEEAKKKVTGGRQRQRMRLKSKKGNDSSAAKESCGKEDIAMKKKSLKDAKQPSGKEGIASLLLQRKKKSEKWNEIIWQGGESYCYKEKEAGRCKGVIWEEGDCYE